jgi:choice-of-anchor B domain-containing protein
MKIRITFLLLISIICFTKTLAQISPAQNIIQRSNLKFLGQSCANIWGYAAKGKEYALVGTKGGSVIVDVTNPDAPNLLKQIPAVTSDWREIKSYRDYAYVTTEGSGQGLQIINLSTLPDTNVAFKSFKTDGNLLEIVKIHALHVDTAKGFAYLYGGTSRIKVGADTISVQGAVVLDVKTDPWNPKYVGHYTANGQNDGYIHDGTVENDTLYGSHVYGGYFSVIDFRDKKNPRRLATQTTPNAFTHNTWLSANHKTLFTTDETPASYLAAYDISDLTNIKLLDKIRTVSEQNAIVHNTYIKNEFAVTSWYTEGVTIVDANRPRNLVQVGQYDTYNGTRATFNGAWGVYPYLPSGNLIVSNIEDGLFVLTPQYKRACYLEGTVIDSVTRERLTGVRVKINSNDPDKKAESNIIGAYATGQVTTGQTTVTYSKIGYFDKTIAINLKAGEVLTQNVELVARGFAQSGNVVASGTGLGIGKAKVTLKSSEIEYTIDAADNGSFYLYNVLPGTYTVYIGAWGYFHKSQTVTISNSVTNHSFRLDKGYQDDFWGDFLWEVSGAATSAAQGKWELGVPLQSIFNAEVVTPPADITTDLGDKCFVTGIGGGQGGGTDVDATTILTSPPMNLIGYQNPILSFSYWFVNTGGTGTPNDKLKVYVTNGIKDSLIGTISESQSAWRGASVSLKGILPFTSTMRVYFTATDDNPGHIMECLVDAFKITEPTSIATIAENWQVKAFPNPFSTAVTLDYQLDKTVAKAEVKMMNLLGQVLEVKKLQNTEGVVSLGESLPMGLYFIQIETEGRVSRSVKVLKN